MLSSHVFGGNSACLLAFERPTRYSWLFSPRAPSYTPPSSHTPLSYLPPRYRLGISFRLPSYLCTPSLAVRWFLARSCSPRRKIADPCSRAFGLNRIGAMAPQLLFLYFGFRMLKEGMESHGGPSEELTEVCRLSLYHVFFFVRRPVTVKKSLCNPKRVFLIILDVTPTIAPRAICTVLLLLLCF